MAALSALYRLRVKVVGSGQTLAYTQRCSVIDQLTQPDPNGELIITVPESIIDSLATVISIELTNGQATHAAQSLCRRFTARTLTPST